MEHPLFPNKIERSAAMGEFKRAGSTDPDVLASVRATLTKSSKSAVGYGWALIGCGVLLCLTIIGIVAGLPLALMGWWVLAQAKANIRRVDGYLAEFTAGLAPAPAAPAATAPATA